MVNITKVDLSATFLSDTYNRIPISGTEGLIRLLCFEPEQSVPLHEHAKGDEYFYVIQGKGNITVGNEEKEAEMGCFIKVPAEVPHKWKSGSKLLTLLSIIVPVQSYAFAGEATKMKFR